MVWEWGGGGDDVGVERMVWGRREDRGGWEREWEWESRGGMKGRGGGGGEGGWKWDGEVFLVDSPFWLFRQCMSHIAYSLYAIII